MAVIASSALLFSLFASGADVVLPLWVTGSLGFTPAQWAQLRSLRMVGVLVGVVVLGALSDRFGERLLGALSMLGIACMLIALALGGGSGLWGAMPFYGAFVSTAFVNLNSLTQYISDRRQGAANSIYRSVGAAAGVVAPLLVTRLAVVWSGYPRVLLALAVCLVAAAAVLVRYPGHAARRPLAGLRTELFLQWASYRSATRERPLMRAIHLQQAWGAALAAVSTFAAIRFTQQLGLEDEQFGALCTVGGVLGFAATALGGLVLDTVSLRRLCAYGGCLLGLCSVVMGLADSVPLTIVGFLAYAPVSALLIAPQSMWVSRAAGSATQAAAFSVHKAVTAVYYSAAIWLLGVLEAMIGIRLILLYSGAIAALLGLLFLALREPRRPARPPGRPGRPEPAGAVRPP